MGEPTSHKQSRALPNPSSLGEGSRSSLCPGITTSRAPPDLLPWGSPDWSRGRAPPQPLPAAGRAGPARGPPGTGLAWAPKLNFEPSFTASGCCPPDPRPTEGRTERGREGGRAALPAPAAPRAVGGRAEGPDALPATNPPPFVFLNHAAARALRPIRSAAAPAGQWRGPPRFFKPSLSPNRRPARSAQPRPPALLTPTGSNGYERQRPPRARPSPGVARPLTSERHTANPGRFQRQGAELRAV